MGNSIYDLVDVRFHKYIKSDDKDNNKIVMMRARDIVNHKRVDIMVKVKYLEALISQDEYDLEYFENLYLETISLFTDGTFIEPGGSDKNTRERFIETFLSIHKSILNQGFNSEESVIPISEIGVPLDGAHRLAVAYLLDLEVPTVKLLDIYCDYGMSFFESRSTDDLFLSKLVMLLADFDKKLRVAIFWPYARVTLDEIKEIFKDSYIFNKELDLNENGVNNLCLTAYENEKWIGIPDNCWSGVWNKSRQCHVNKNKTYVVLFESCGYDHDLSIKERFRKGKGGDKHSIHSTDSFLDSLKLIHTVFVPYSDKYLNSIDLQGLKKIVEFLNKERINAEKIIITGSSVLELLSVRDSNDVDFIYEDVTAFKHNDYDDFIKMSHNGYEHYFSAPIKKLFIYGTFTFYFFKLRFISLPELSVFKCNRNEKKDKDDLILIKGFFSNNGLNILTKQKRNLIVRYNVTIRRLKKFAIESLKKIGLYMIIKNILRMRKK